MAGLNERQLAHRRAMLAHLSQVARRRDFRAGAWPRAVPSGGASSRARQPQMSIVPMISRSAEATAAVYQPSLPY